MKRNHCYETIGKRCGVSSTAENVSTTRRRPVINCKAQIEAYPERYAWLGESEPKKVFKKAEDAL